MESKTTIELAEEVPETAPLTGKNYSPALQKLIGSIAWGRNKDAPIPVKNDES